MKINGRFAFSFVCAAAAALLFGGCIVRPIGGYGYGGYSYGGYGYGRYSGMGAPFAQPIMVQPAGPAQMLPNPQLTQGAFTANQTMAGGAMVGGQQGQAYITRLNPANPYGISDSVPAPGMAQMQTGCPGGWYFVPITGTCRQSSPAAWEPRAYFVSTGGGVIVPTRELGPNGGIQGVPGQTMPVGVYRQPGYYGTPVYQQPYYGGW